MNELETESSTILVMGARGSVGRRVLDELVRLGTDVRASARHWDPGQLPAGVTGVQADLTDPDSLRAAFDGVAQAFVYAVPEGLAAAVEAIGATPGLRRVVLMSSGSVLLPSCVDNLITVEHREVEAAFSTAATGYGFDLVPIRPLVLATNALGWAWQLRTAETLDLYQPDALTAPIHEADIAAVAVAALRGTAADAGRISDVLTGPRRLSQRDQVAQLGRASGREIAVREETRAAALARFSHFMPAAEAEAVVGFIDDTAAGNSPATDAVSAVLGRPALEFDRWAADHLDDFRPESD